MPQAKVDKARQYLIDQYVEALSEGRIPWAKGWESTYHSMENGSTGKSYRGMNQLILLVSAESNHFKDYRWYTFNQARELGYKVKKGSHGTPLSHPTIYLNNKSITIEEYNGLSSEEAKRCIWGRYNFTVFNAEQIDGVPELQIESQPRTINGSALVEQIRSGLGTKLHFGGDEAYYMPLSDTIQMPNKEQFFSEEEYDSTLLHELCHSTGHPDRLNRDLSGRFGSQKYAKEELRAEIASSFLMQSLQLPLPQDHIDNHKAYIQSWISVLKNEPDELFKAINDATTIENYALEKGGISKEKVRTAVDKEKAHSEKKVDKDPKHRLGYER